MSEEHTHDLELIAIEISSDESMLRYWYECQTCGKGIYKIRHNKWKPEVMDRTCPQCGKQLILFDRYRKENKYAKDKWNKVCCTNARFIGCQGYPECRYKEHEQPCKRPRSLHFNGIDIDEQEGPDFGDLC